MPHIYPNLPRIEEYSDGDWLVVLSSVELRSLIAVVDQIYWDLPLDTSEKIHLALLEAERMSELTNVLSEIVDKLENLASCVCSNGANQTTVIQYNLPPDYKGENPGYLSSTEFNETTPVPEPIRNQGFPATFEGWQDYTCKAVEHLRRASVRMTEELLRVFDLPAITLTLLAAVLAALAVIYAEASMLMLVLAPSLMAQLGSALITVGQGGLEAVRDYLMDNENIHWHQIACIVRSSLTAREAQARILEYMETTAPAVAYPIMTFYPWEPWVDQIYKGTNVDGTVLDVTGLESLCIDCPDNDTGFLGTGVTDCVLNHWIELGNCRLFEGSVSCEGDGSAPFILFNDGIYGKFFSEPVTAKSPLFQVNASGDYKFRYRLAGWGGEEGNASIKIFLADDTVIGSFTLTADNLDGSSRLTDDTLALDSGVDYYAYLEMGKFWFECFNSSLEIQ